MFLVFAIAFSVIENGNGRILQGGEEGKARQGSSK